MNEIEEQYAIYLAKGVVVDKDGFPVGSDVHVLGGRRGNAATAAEARRKKNSNSLTHGNVLGGGRKKPAVPKDPKEAARIAAERRLLDSKYCLPCSEVIEILGDSSDEEDNDSEVEFLESAKGRSSKSKSKRNNHALDLKPRAIDCTQTATTSVSQDDCVIDLTEESFDMTESSSFEDYFKGSASAGVEKKPELNTMSHGEDEDKYGKKNWICPRCTLHNRSIFLVCEACNLERPPSKHQQKKLRDEQINYVKQKEVVQSRQKFGGFNIYGDKKDSRRH